MIITNKSIKKDSLTQPVAALERALAILGAFERQQGAISLAQLAELTDLHKSTILRLMISLEEHGYIRHRPDGLYSIGPTMFHLGVKYEKSQTGRDILMPALEALVQAGTESASFHVREGERRLCVYRVDSHHSTLDTVAAGMYLPLDRGAAGHVLLNNSAHPTPRFGLELSKGERDPACWGLAAPVYGRDGMLLGALSLSGPKERFTKVTIAAMRKLLLESALSCSEQSVSIRKV
jgi:DNA-binding IclR family transcriptional regulator